MISSDNNESPLIHLSVVSHGQWPLVQLLLADLSRVESKKKLHVTIIFNLPEVHDLANNDYGFSTSFIINPSPRGFGDNHNQAFNQKDLPESLKFFLVINPDIRISEEVFLKLIGSCQSPANNIPIGVIAPRIVNSLGKTEDSAREIPTPMRILSKALGRKKAWSPPATNKHYHPDWIAGMFMIFPYEAYKSVCGFNNKFFLYYEDVDICCRLWLSGYSVVVDPTLTVVHNAQRDSHRKLKYLLWHIRSMMLFFISPTAFRAKRFLQKRESV